MNNFVEEWKVQLHKKQELRYGENPHQIAALYTPYHETDPCSIVKANILQGKELSFNNIVDADTALECVKQFDKPACVIVKHANPCGVAVRKTIYDAYIRAYNTDPTSAFGGIIAFNQTLDEQTARRIIEKQFVEVIVAPGITTDAINVLKIKPNIRVLEVAPPTEQIFTMYDYKNVNGGVLIQTHDDKVVTINDLQCVTKRIMAPSEIDGALFGWKVAKFVKSNAIVYVFDHATVGIGAGQMSRVDSATIGITKAFNAGLGVQGSIMVSDAMFPFRDSVDAAAEAGVSAIIQPGGSIRDSEVIEGADEHNIAMVFTGIRHFRH